MILGIDVGGTTIKFGLVSSNGELKESSRVDTLENTTTPEKFIQTLIDKVKHYQSISHIDGIGIGMPGQLSIDRHILEEAANLSTLNGTNIYKPLKEAFPELLIRIENDANCAALGELYFGGHNLDHFVLMALGTGVGGGVIINRNLFIGAHGNAGEIGKVPVGDNNAQNLEDCIGQRNLVNYVKQQLDQSKYSDSLLHNVAEITVEEVYNYAKQGDALALDVFDYVGELIGQSLVSIIHCYDVSKIIIGGGVGKSYELFVKQAKARAAKQLTPYYLKNFDILPAGKKADTGLLGAAALILNLKEDV
jgi:glucokinase